MSDPKREIDGLRRVPENLGVEEDDEGRATWGTAGQNIGLELPKVCRRRDEAPNPQGAEPIAIRGATPASMRSKPEKTTETADLRRAAVAHDNAGRRCGGGSNRKMVGSPLSRTPAVSSLSRA